MIKLESVEFSYQQKKVLHNIQLSVTPGEFVGLIGPNGAGKSTLLKLIDRILHPGSGRISVRNKPLESYTRKELARIMGYVQQNFSTAYNYSVMDIILMGRFPYQRVWTFESRLDREIALKAMETTDCIHLKEREFATLSGGEKQLVILASALAQEPDILLLDEPTAALDLKHQFHFYQILKKLQFQQQKTVISVTHDVNLASQFCNRIIILKDGTVRADGPVKEVLQAQLIQEIYGIPVQVIPHPESNLPVILPTFSTKSE
ncbi:MAG: ATP-binding cassette domain-containing protein [Calditrichae bacterium]|nr:ATP-binding cassette domain-containing protein [Calditrichia bacterium]